MSNGQEEISLSIEETNALRAKLGLKPLKLQSTGSASVRLVPVDKKPSNDDQKADSSEKAEGKRLVAAISSGGGVLDVFGEGEGLGDWLRNQSKRPKADASNSSKSHTDSESSSDSEDSSAESSAGSLSSSNSN